MRTLPHTRPHVGARRFDRRDCAGSSHDGSDAEYLRLSILRYFVIESLGLIGFLQAFFQGMSVRHGEFVLRSDHLAVGERLSTNWKTDDQTLSQRVGTINNFRNLANATKKSSSLPVW